MKLTFHGATHTVTGSKHIVELEDGTTFLLDCGMYQGMGKHTHVLNRQFGFDPKRVNFLVLSHAHIDHSGLIPRLVKEGFTGKIYCTEATYDLCEIMLADSAYIQEADVNFYNKRRKKEGLEPFESLYTIEDVNKCLEHFVMIPYDQEHKINDFVRVTFTNNSHILGSATVNLRITEGSDSKRLCYTGDIGRFNVPLLKNPSKFPQPDFIICESTYGDRLHTNIEDAEKEVLHAAIETCQIKKGKLIIPSFSLGRTQEIVYALNKLDLKGLLPDVKIFVDSPLSVSATEITRKHIDLLNDKVKAFTKGRKDPFGFDDLIYINGKKESQALNGFNEPCIIISASGMADAGRVKHHIMHNIKDPRNTILLVGYAEPESLAGKLRNGDEHVKIFDEDFPVKADVKVLESFSAHGDYKEMIKYLKFIDPKKVQKMFLVHGEPKAQEAFKEHLKDADFNNIYIPGPHDEYYA